MNTGTNVHMDGPSHKNLPTTSKPANNLGVVSGKSATATLSAQNTEASLEKAVGAALLAGIKASAEAYFPIPAAVVTHHTPSKASPSKYNLK